MKKRKRNLHRIAAFAMAAALLGNSLDFSAFAQGVDTGDGTVSATASETAFAIVTAFAGLSDDVKTQKLEVGADESAIALPESLTVTVTLTTVGSSGEQDQSDTDSTEGETQTEPKTEAQNEPNADPAADGEEQDGEAAAETQAADTSGTETQTQETSVSGTEAQTQEQPATSGTEAQTQEQPATPGTEAQTQEQPAASGTEAQTQEQPATPGTEAQAQETSAPATEAQTQAEPQTAAAAAVQSQAESAEPKQAEPPTEAPAAKTEAGTKEEKTQAEGGVLTSLLDTVFPAMTVSAAEASAANPEPATTTKTVTLTELTWKIDADQSSAAEFSSENAEAKYVYVPVLPDTVTIDGAAYTLVQGESAPLPEITVTIERTIDQYGTKMDEGPTGECTWTLYDTDGDNTGDLLVISGNGATGDYGHSATFYEEQPWASYTSAVKKVIIEEGVTVLGSDLFYDFNGLEAVELPGGLTEIKENVFYRCLNLESITLPNTLRSIGKSVFFYCESLTEIRIPEGVTKIENGVFENCTGLKSVTLPDTLTEIGEDAFAYCGELTMIIPAGVTQIGSAAFNLVPTIYNLSGCKIEGMGGDVIGHRVTLVRDGVETTQSVIPAEDLDTLETLDGKAYRGTAYDPASYDSSAERNGAWYVKSQAEEGGYERVTSATSFQDATFYYAKTFDASTIEATVTGDSAYSCTVTVKDRETGKVLTEGTHYTKTISAGAWEGSGPDATQTVTVTLTGLVEGGYAGSLTAAYPVKAAASVSAGGNTVYYVSFEEAWAAAKEESNGDTQAVLTLLQDVTVNDTLTVESGDNIVLTGAASLSGDVNAKDSGLINVTGGSFTFSGGTVSNGSGGTNAIAVNGGSFVLNGGNAAAHASGNSGICVYGGTADFQSGSASGDIGVAKVGATAFTLSGGTYSGTSSAVYVDGRLKETVKDLLGERKAYYAAGAAGEDAGTLIIDMSGKTLSGTVTVGDCTHSSESWTDNGDGTHTGTCTVCGLEVTAAHTLDETGTKCTVCQAKLTASAKVEGSEPLYFETIEQAWAYAKEKSREAGTVAVSLLKAAEVTAPLTVEEGESILLESGSISGALNGYGIIEVKGGSFTMEDGTLSNTYGRFYDSDRGGFYVLHVTGGTAAIHGGTLDNGGKSNGHGTGVQMAGGSLQITGGSIEANWQAVNADGKADIRIDGGSLEAVNIGVYLTGSKLHITGGSIDGLIIQGSNVEITGGTIATDNSSGVQVVDSGTPSSTLVISGGEISGSNYGLVIGGEIASGKITGGTFTGGTASISVRYCPALFLYSLVRGSDGESGYYYYAADGSLQTRIPDDDLKNYPRCPPQRDMALSR